MFEYVLLVVCCCVLVVGCWLSVFGFGCSVDGCFLLLVVGCWRSCVVYCVLFFDCGAVS